MPQGRGYGWTPGSVGTLQNIHERYLRTALRKSQYTNNVIQQIAENDSAARNFLDGDEGEEEPRPQWRTADDRARFRKYEMNQDLYHNRQEEHLMPEWLPDGKSFYQRWNFLRFITKVYTDLMLGKGSDVTTKYKQIDDYIKDVARLPSYFGDWATQVSMIGLLGLQIIVDEDGVDIIEIDPGSLYWNWKEGTHNDYEWIAKKIRVDPRAVEEGSQGQWEFRQHGDDSVRADGVIFEERHFRGHIDYFLYSVEDDFIVEVLDPTWFNQDLPICDEEGMCFVETGVNQFMLQIIPNILVTKEFVSDYDDVIDFQRSINLRATQRQRILNIHADPKLMVPEGLQQKDVYTGETIMRSIRDEVLFLAPEDYQFKPEYLTWDAQLSHVETELKDNIDGLCTLAEISPTLVANRDQAFPESGTAYKMKLTPTLNRVSRKERDFKDQLQVLLWVFIFKLLDEGKLKTAGQHAMPTHDSMVEDDINATPTSASTNLGGRYTTSGQLQPVNPPTDDANVGVPALNQQQPTTLAGALVTDPSTITAADWQAFVRPQDITIEFKPSIPQDEKLIIERTGGKATMSRHRALSLVDGLSDEEIVKELIRIDEDEAGAAEAMFPGSMNNTEIMNPMGSTGPPPPPPPPLDASGGLGLTEGQAQMTDVLPSGSM